MKEKPEREGWRGGGVVGWRGGGVPLLYQSLATNIIFPSSLKATEYRKRFSLTHSSQLKYIYTIVGFRGARALWRITFNKNIASSLK